MAKPEATFVFQIIRHHTVILLVAAVDRRIVPALRFVSRLPHVDVRALHISIDADETRQLAHDWMNLGLSWLPLEIQEATEATLPASVRRAVQQEAGEGRTLTVVLPELEFHRWWQFLLHRRTARHIAHQLQALPSVTPVIVPFSPPARGLTRADYGLLRGARTRG